MSAKNAWAKPAISEDPKGRSGGRDAEAWRDDLLKCKKENQELKQENRLLSAKIRVIEARISKLSKETVKSNVGISFKLSRF